MTLYTNTAVENLATEYYEHGGDVITVEEGCLLEWGLGVFTGPGLKTAIIREIYLNEWSSAYSVRMYNKMPAKYESMLDNMFYV